MDGNDKDFGWEDVGPTMIGSGQIGSQLGGQLGGQLAGAAISGAMAGAAGEGGEGAMSDAVTNAMISHLTREFSKGSMSLFPQWVSIARQYFNVTHGYVLRKMAWQLVPLPSTKKKSTEGEIGGEKDWTSRMFEGLEVDIEEPDLYIPSMGFVTYVLLCGLIRGLQDEFTPDVLSAAINFAVVLLVVEAAVIKGVLFTAGAVNAPVADLVSLLSYKYFYLSLQLIFGLILGWGHKPSGFLYPLLALGLFVSCGVALWQALRRLTRMQPSMGQECVTDLHKTLIKAVPVIQALVCWTLLPSWPKVQVVSVNAALKVVTAAPAAVAASAAPVAVALAKNATGTA